MKTAKTRTQKLAEAIEAIYNSHKTEIASLPVRGIAGGHNSRFIPGWQHIGDATITRAAGLTSLPLLNWWSGSAPTPAKACPECVYSEIHAAHNKIFNATKP